LTRGQPAGAPRGRLLVVSGPGGVGKGTVVAALARARPELAVSVSATTRPPRPGEVDGRHYHFLTADAFDALAAADGFLEWAEFNGHRYGTPWTSIRDPLAAGRPVVLEIDIQGARQVRDAFGDAVLVFLAPPSPEALEARLRRRGDDAEAIARRLAIARWELAQADDFDHVVVNDRLDDAVAALGRILDATSA
jgi:guanylate kinase